MKKAISIVMICALLLCVVPLGTLPVSAETSGDYTYTVTDGEATITDYTDPRVVVVTLPSTLGGYPVTSIGYEAFLGCSSLTSVTIPDSVTSIGDYAFARCSRLTSITIPSSVTSIGQSPFFGCSSLTGIAVDENNTAYTSQDGVLFNKAMTTLIQYPIGNANTTYMIPDSVTSIGYEAFWGCSSLTSVTIGDRVTSIDRETFEGCSSLTSVTIGNSVTSIGYEAFRDCSSLTSVTIGDSVTSIGSYAFWCCSSLISITIPDSVTSIGAGAFLYCSGLTSVTIGDGVTSIGNNAFSECTRLRSVYITDLAAWCQIDFEGGRSNPVYYAQNLYLNGTLVTDLVIPDSVTRIWWGAFYNCSSLTSITIPDNVTSIGSYAFEGCSSLTSVRFYSKAQMNKFASLFSGKEIVCLCAGEHTFANNPYECSVCTYAWIPDAPTLLKRTQTSITLTPIPGYEYSRDRRIWQESSTFTGLTANTEYQFYQRCAATAISPAYTVKTLKPIEELLYYTVYEKEITVTGGDPEISGEVTIPSKISGYPVAAIANGAFQDFTDITSVTIPAGVTSIGDYAFAGCSNLTGIMIPDSVTSIGDNAFANSDIALLVNEGSYAYKYAKEKGLPVGEVFDGGMLWSFNEATGLLTISGTGAIKDFKLTTENETYLSTAPWAIYTDQITSVYIAKGVTDVGANAFACCANLTSVEFSDTVRTIKDAFWGCENILTVKFGSNIESITGCEFDEAVEVHISDLANWCNVEISPNSTFYNAILYVDGKIAKDIVIPEGVKQIADNAFAGFINITNVVIPEGVTSIGYQAFWRCAGLTGVSIPSTVTYIGEHAFNLCDSVKNVYISDVGAWFNITFENYSANPLSFADNLYLNNTLLTVLDIPDGVTKIKAFAFYDFQGFHTIVVPASLISIEDDAFLFCSVHTVVFETGRDYVQALLSNITCDSAHVIIPDSVEYVFPNSFPKVAVFGSTGSVSENYAIDNEFTFYKTPKAISIASPPEKQIYYQSKSMDRIFSTKGLLLQVEYYDGTFETVDTDFFTSDFDIDKEGRQDITVFFGGQTTSFTVTVAARELSSIAVTASPAKTKYIVGESFSGQGLVVTGYYDEGPSTHLDITEGMITGFDNTKVGVQTLTVTYQGKTATFEIEVVPKAVERIEISQLPDKRSYLEAREALDVTGGRLTLYYNDQTSNTIDLETYMVSGFDNTTPGTQKLTVAYGGKTTMFDVTIVAKTLSGISIFAVPTKTEFVVSTGTLDTTGGKILLAYNNGTSEIVDITVEMVSGFDNTIVGKQTLTVTYKGFTNTYEVEIIAKLMTSIAVTTKPTKEEYLEAYDALNVAGGKVTLYYNNDETDKIDLTADMVSGFDNTIVGKQTLTVTYKGFTDTYEVEIIAKTLTHLVVTTKPNKLAYTEGEALDATGLVVTAYYNNGTSADITDYTISGDISTPGAKTVTVSYGGFSDTFDVVVEAKKNGWVLEGSNWFYYLSGEKATGWQCVNNTWYYLNGAGIMQTGWLYVNNTWYYLNAGGAMATGWQYIGGSYYYLNEGGAMQTGWLYVNNTWYYLNAGGAMTTGWQYIGGSYYYLNESGAMQTGWLRLGGTWYYLNAGGAMQTGWLNLGGTWYYMNAGGAMQTGWLNLGGTWYYMNAGGAMQIGWLNLGGTWYYMNAGGAMQTGWQRLGGVWYYFYDSGAMATNCWIGNYWINAGGVWVA